MRALEEFVGVIQSDFESTLTTSEWNEAIQVVPQHLRDLGIPFDDIRPITDYLYELLPPNAKDPVTPHKTLRFFAYREGVRRLKERLQPEFTQKIWFHAKCKTKQFQAPPCTRDVRELIHFVTHVNEDEIRAQHQARFGEDYRTVDWTKEDWADETQIPQPPPKPVTPQQQKEDEQPYEEEEWRE